MPRPNHGAMGLAFLACRALQFLCLVVVMGMTARFIGSIVDDSQQPPQPLIGVLSVVCFAILYTIITIILYWDLQLPLLATAAFDGLFFIALMVTSIIIGKPLSYISCKAVGHTAGAGQIVNSVASNLNQWAPEAAAPTTTSWAAETAAAAATTTPAAVPTPTTAAVQYVTTTIANAAATVAATLAPGETAQVQGSDGKMYTVSGAMLARRDLGDAVMKVVDYESWLRAGPENSCTMMKAVWGFGIALTILFVFSAACMAFVWRQERCSAPKKIEDAES
ncbi:hypothetical protein EDC01DRAFT_287185 [Geopyxis carbonaria]|nr:hypothetical protein EDC01DRAFT_287185 [Geopyxis carbonaria]